MYYVLHGLTSLVLYSWKHNGPNGPPNMNFSPVPREQHVTSKSIGLEKKKKKLILRKVLFSTHLDSLWPPISSTSISFRLSLRHSALASSVFVSDQRLLFIFTPRIRWVRDRALRFVASLILNSSISVSVELFICSLSTIYCVCVKKRIILER